MNLTKGIRGTRGFPFNDTGLRQVHKVAAALAPLEPSFIVSSPPVRTHQTTGALSSPAGIDVKTDDRPKEYSFGPSEGLTGVETEERLPERYRAWRQAKEPKGVDTGRQTDIGRRANRATED